MNKPATPSLTILMDFTASLRSQGFSYQNTILYRLRVPERIKQSPIILIQSLFPLWINLWIMWISFGGSFPQRKNISVLLCLPLNPQHYLLVILALERTPIFSSCSFFFIISWIVLHSKETPWMFFFFETIVRTILFSICLLIDIRISPYKVLESVSSYSIYHTQRFFD